MIECPEFDYDYEKTHAVYLWCLHISTGISLLVNPFIIYCIIFRSTSHMATYRWFLLLHQIAAFIPDIYINLFAQGVLIFPFPAGYLLGPAKYITSPYTVYALGQFFLTFEQFTVVLTFFYRYQAVHNARTISFHWKCFLLSLVILCISNIYFPLSVEVRSEETFRELSARYSCITPTLLKIHGIEAVDKAEILPKVLALIVINCITFIVSIIFLTIGSWRATKTKNMSPKLRQMQQKFIFQLSLQSFLPFVAVITPIFVIAIVVGFDIFGFYWLSDVILTSMSLFSIISAVVLFLMNPTYHQWLTRHFISKKTQLHRISSVIPSDVRCQK